MTIILYKLPSIIKGKIISRPSKLCKSPYVADVILENNEQQIIAHSPSLGCSGYANSGEYVYLIKNENPKLCTHVIHLACRNEKNTNYLVGIHPKSAEIIVQYSLLNNHINKLKNISNLQREKTFLNSRFDFICKDENNRQTIIEVKNVPCADYEDIEQKQRKKMDFSNRDINSKIAYFPDGYRKKKNDIVSPRALKHIKELQRLKEENPEYRCILIFVIQRKDVCSFQASIVDPIYKQALNEAYVNGVEIIPIQVYWNDQGECIYHKELNYNP